MIDTPTLETNKPEADPGPKTAATAVAEVFSEFRKLRDAAHDAIVEARPAFIHLCQVMAQRTNQSYHVRAILFSLWNGKPTSLLEVVNLDRAIRKDVCSVICAFGCHDGKDEFFYEAISGPLKNLGLFEWFIAESEVEG
jgi:hypothetical protein